MTVQAGAQGARSYQTELARHPASRREIIILIAYFALLVLITDIINVRLGVELMTIAVLVAAAAITRDVGGFLQDWWFLLAGIVLWNLSGPLAAFSPFPWHLNFMMRGDELLFFGHNPAAALQHHLARIHHVSPLDVLAFITYNLHVPEPYIAGYLLWRLDRVVYMRFAAAALLLLVIGFAAFILFPAVPPWMASTKFGRLHGVYNGFGDILHQDPVPFHGTPIFYIFKWRGDAVAAFPSEHAAFPMLEFLAFSAQSRRGRWLFLWVVWIVFVVVYLGEHWVTDAVAGWVLALVSWGAVALAIRFRPGSGAPPGHS